MAAQKFSASVDIGGGRELVIETGKLAKQADGSVTVRLGDTVVISTACCGSSPRPVDFMPLTVDYREYTYAGGRIPGGWFKREGRMSEKEILACRITDRSVRPFFPDGWRTETQLISLSLSADGVNDPDVLGLVGSTTALALGRTIPFPTNVTGVRVARVDGEFILFPTHEQRDAGDLDLVLSGTEDAICMVEAGGIEVSEEVILDAFEVAHDGIRKVIAAQKELAEKLGINKPVFEAPAKPWSDDFAASVAKTWRGKLAEALAVKDKLEQGDAIRAVKAEAVEALGDDADADEVNWTKAVLSAMVKEITRTTILSEGKRLDGRAFDEVRGLGCEVDLMPRTHGSSLFTRGETQALVTCTLGTQRDQQIIEGFEGDKKHNFLLHYNFPPFSVGEARFLRGPGRREIGHGNLARRALAPMVPTIDEFPYTLRVVSDILESNGSSSMASVCGGSLSLMAAGVPLKKAVAGIAMGLVSDGETHAVLSDIAGQEDHYGDMDFKVAGTRDGINALQMDIKLEGLSREILETALAQAKKARLEILDAMDACIDASREDISPYAPRIFQIKIDPDHIRTIIGPGGKMIRSIVERTGAEINVEDDGTVSVSTNDQAAADAAIAIIEGILEQPEIGKNYEGPVKRLEPWGAFIEILPGTDGLLHISEVAWERTADIRDVMNLGDMVKVQVIGIDGQDRVKLSRRILIDPPEGVDPEQMRREAEEQRRDRGGRGRGGDRGRGRGGRDRR